MALRDRIQQAMEAARTRRAERQGDDGGPGILGRFRERQQEPWQEYDSRQAARQAGRSPILEDMRTRLQAGGRSETPLLDKLIAARGQRGGLQAPQGAPVMGAPVTAPGLPGGPAAGTAPPAAAPGGFGAPNISNFLSMIFGGMGGGQGSAPGIGGAPVMGMPVTNPVPGPIGGQNMPGELGRYTAGQGVMPFANLMNRFQAPQYSNQPRPITGTVVNPWQMPTNRLRSTGAPMR